jgi:hypothetical protein
MEVREKFQRPATLHRSSVQEVERQLVAQKKEPVSPV